MSILTAQVGRFYTDIWNRQDRGQLATVLHKDFTFRGSLGMVKRGHEEFWGYVQYVIRALADYQCLIQDQMEQDNRVFARMLFQGRHVGSFLGVPPTGRQLAWQGAALFTFDGSLVADLWVLGDVDGLKAQLRPDGEEEA